MANTRKVLLSLHIEVADRLDQELNKSELIDVLAAAHYGLRFEGDSTAAMKRQTMLDKLTTVSTETVTAPLPEPMAVPVEVASIPEPIFPPDDINLTNNVEVVDVAKMFETVPTPENVIATTTTVATPVVVESLGDVNANPVESITVASPEGVTQPIPAFVPVAPVTGFVPQVQPLEAIPVPEVAPVVEPVQPEILPTKVSSLVEAVAAATVAVDPPLPTPSLVLEPVSVQVEPGTMLNPSGQRICPTCKQPMITPLCLNCL